MSRIDIERAKVLYADFMENGGKMRAKPMLDHWLTMLDREELVRKVIAQYRRSTVRGELNALEDLDAACKELSEWKP